MELNTKVREQGQGRAGHSSITCHGDSVVQGRGCDSQDAMPRMPRMPRMQCPGCDAQEAIPRMQMSSTLCPVCKVEDAMPRMRCPGCDAQYAMATGPRMLGAGFEIP